MKPRGPRHSSARCVGSEAARVSHLLDRAFLRQALLQLLLQLLPGAQRLLHSQEVGELLQPRVREVLSKVIYTLPVNGKEFLREERGCYATSYSHFSKHRGQHSNTKTALRISHILEERTKTDFKKNKSQVYFFSIC